MPWGADMLLRKRHPRIRRVYVPSWDSWSYGYFRDVSSRRPVILAPTVRKISEVLAKHGERLA